jgi:hypothetical protein
MTSKFLKAILLKAGSWLTVVVLVVMLAACADFEDDRIEPVPVGYVSLYNAVPDAPGLDISVDERQLNNTGTFDYADYSGYLNFRTGDRTIKFTTANAANALAEAEVEVNAQKAYSVFLINRLADVETLVVRDSSAAPAQGKAMIRFIQLSPDAPEVTVEYADESATPWVSNAAFKDVSDFIEVDAATYTFNVKNKATDESIVEAESVRIQAGGYYTIITRGFTNPPAGNANIVSIEVL